MTGPCPPQSRVRVCVKRVRKERFRSTATLEMGREEWLMTLVGRLLSSRNSCCRRCATLQPVFLPLLVSHLPLCLSRSCCIIVAFHICLVLVLSVPGYSLTMLQDQRMVCRFGTECRNPKCKFTHPPGVGEVRICVQDLFLKLHGKMESLEHPKVER